MGTASAAAVLQLPVQLQSIKLGRPVDILLDVDAWRVVGFVVLCGDDTQRFLPYAAAHTGPDEIAVPSALMLLDDVGFYRQRGVSFRSLLGGTAQRGARPAGRLVDVTIGAEGAVTELVVERGDGTRRLPAAGSVVLPTRATAA